MYKICPVCETSFSKPKRMGYVAWNKKQYCSSKCYNQAHKPVIKQCLICKKEFKAYKYSLKLGYGQYCSMKCYSEFRKTITGEKSYRWKGGMAIKECLICGKEFTRSHATIRKGFGKFCSRQCFIKALPNLVPSGEDSYMWKGNNVGYNGLHQWIKRYLGRPKQCEHCRTIINNPKSIHWANKDHTYKRNLIDWLRLCASCHKIYDLSNGLSQH